MVAKGMTVKVLSAYNSITHRFRIMKASDDDLMRLERRVIRGGNGY